jgi:glycerol-3-phosphate dehydrogenase
MNLKATSNLDHSELFKQHSVILVAIPTQHMRSILKQITTHISNDHLLIFVSKGIEICSGLLPNEMVKEVLGAELAESSVFLSGPSFAAEVVRRLPVSFNVPRVVVLLKNFENFAQIMQRRPAYQWLLNHRKEHFELNRFSMLLISAYTTPKTLSELKSRGPSRT